MAGLRVLVAQEQAWIVEKARSHSMNVAAARHPVLRRPAVAQSIARPHKRENLRRGTGDQGGA